MTVLVVAEMPAKGNSQTGAIRDNLGQSPPEYQLEYKRVYAFCTFRRKLPEYMLRVVMGQASIGKVTAYCLYDLAPFASFGCLVLLFLA